jgi:hypothetical protein
LSGKKEKEKEKEREERGKKVIKREFREHELTIKNLRSRLIGCVAG